MNNIITGRNEVVAKVIFLHLSVILFTGGCLPRCMLGYHPPPEQTAPGADTCLGADTPWSRHPLEQTLPSPQEQTHPPQSRHSPRADTQPPTPPPGADTPSSRHPTGADTPRSRLRHTVNERLVCILLECILVLISIFKIEGFLSNQMNWTDPVGHELWGISQPGVSFSYNRNNS